MSNNHDSKTSKVDGDSSNSQKIQSETIEAVEVQNVGGSEEYDYLCELEDSMR
jgi:hypothetical protein